MTTYMICDGDGYALTDGLQEHEARRVAQQKANDRLESVWLSESGSEEEGEEFEPNPKDPVVKARMALEEWEPDEAASAEIAQIFVAIYEREPATDEDAASMIYAAKDVITAAEAARLNKVI
jgi:hypothetical protein